MKFKELEQKLNQLIGEEGVNNPHTFDGKDELKRWIETKITEIVGTDLVGKWNERDTKYQVERTYNGKDNYVRIEYRNRVVCTVNFKYSRDSHYEHWYTVTTYGIKSIEFEMSYGFESETFEEAKKEVIKHLREEQNEHMEYLQKQHDEIKQYFERTGLTIDDLVEGCSLLKCVNYDDQKQYEKEFNNGKEVNWYKFSSRY